MRVLIIDDSDYKSQEMRAFLNDCGLASDVQVAKSFHGALRAIKESKPELVLLDMCLPTSESDDGELAGRARVFGGKDLLAEMEFENILSAVILISQFEYFQSGTNSSDFKSLLSELQKRYPKLVIGGVFYSGVDYSWRNELRIILKQQRLC